MELTLDLSYLNEISAGDTEFIGSILSTFLEETPKDIVNIKEAISQQAIADLGKLAHKNKSSLHILGLAKVKEVALNIELMAKKDKENPAILTQANSLVNQLSAALVLVEAALLKLS